MPPQRVGHARRRRPRARPRRVRSPAISSTSAPASRASRRGLGEAFGVDVGDADAAAARRELHRDLAAEAAGGAGDERSRRWAGVASVGHVGLPDPFLVLDFCYRYHRLAVNRAGSQSGPEDE